MASGRDVVRFKNDYGHLLSVAYMRLEWSCQNECGEPWEVRGWINLQPGETQTRANPTENRWFYYYAEATDGAVWIGPYFVQVKDVKFSHCSCLGITTSAGPAPWVGMRVLDTANYAGVRFIP